MTTDIDRVETVIWKRIRETQESGVAVRNIRLAREFGGAYGHYDSATRTSRTPYCLLGALGASSDPLANVPYNNDDARRAAFVDIYQGVATRLEVTTDAITSMNLLEAGFEGWGADTMHSYNRLTLPDDYKTSPFYVLGQKIAQRLFEEEQLKHDAFLDAKTD